VEMKKREVNILRQSRSIGRRIWLCSLRMKYERSGPTRGFSYHRKLVGLDRGADRFSGAICGMERGEFS
jgi:hypothetical protein